LPVTSALGALLFGLTEGHAVRQAAPDGSSVTLHVEKVRQFRRAPYGIFSS
jgi:hypothetical protein